MTAHFQTNKQHKADGIPSVAQTEKLEAQQQTEECRAQVAGIQAEMHSLRIQLGHAATRPAPSPAPLQPMHNPGVAACHPLQSVLGNHFTFHSSISCCLCLSVVMELPTIECCPCCHSSMCVPYSHIALQT